MASRLEKPLSRRLAGENHVDWCVCCSLAQSLDHGHNENPAIAAE
jgi:hypothetical protein